MKINELKEGPIDEIIVVVVQQLYVRYPWKCFDCSKHQLTQGVWQEGEQVNFCPKCCAKSTNARGSGLWVQKVSGFSISDETGTTELVLWNQDVDPFYNQFPPGSKIKIMQAFSKDGKQINLGGFKAGKGIIVKQ